MEAAFLQGTLTSKPDVSARRPSRSSASSVPGLSPLSEDWQHGRAQGPDLETHSQALEDEAGAGETVAADVRALKWASRNTWFGSDVDMTTLAYEVSLVCEHQIELQQHASQVNCPVASFWS